MKMYKTPETEIFSIEMTATLCASIGFGSDKASGSALSPGRKENIETF